MPVSIYRVVLFAMNAILSLQFDFQGLAEPDIFSGIHTSVGFGGS